MKPDWLVIQPPSISFERFKKEFQNKGLHTVCQESHCPNMAKCWDSGTATFLIMGGICTRNCKFCAVPSGSPLPLNKKEPNNLAEMAEKLNLGYVVITSVDRDDLSDKGAGHFANCVYKLVEKNIKIEALIPDYQEVELRILIKSKPNVVAHNLEVVESLQSLRDKKASYKKSLNTLMKTKDISNQEGVVLYTKSSIMLGLGEEKKEVVEAMQDLRNVGVDILTFGQYLAPSNKHAKVRRYLHPSKFAEYQKIGKKIGFKVVAAGPFVRSSFKAGEILSNMICQ